MTEILDPVDEVLTNYSIEQQAEMLAELEGYSSVPVDIDTFIEDEYYLGNIWGGVHEDGDYEGQPKVFPFWRKHLRDIYPNPFTSPYDEVALTGAIGIGKSACATIGLAYDMYKMLLLKNPQETFGHPKSKIFATALFTAKKSLGQVVLYNDLMEIVHNSPFFRKLYGKKPGQPTVIFSGKNLAVMTGSQFSDALGQAIFQAVIDEADFQTVRLDQVVDNYTHLKRRIETRFMKAGGRFPARLWICSSKTDTHSFLEEHIHKNRDNPKLKVVEAAVWEVHAHNREKYGGKTFPVFCGDSNKEPQLLPIGQPIPEHLDPSLVIDVPVEHYNSFETNILGSLRDIAGKSTTSKFKLFRSRSQLNNALIVPSAFTKDVIQLDEQEKGDRLQDYLSDYFHEIKMRDAPHFLHMDPALTGDRFGLAMCHPHGTKEVVRVDPISGKRSVFQELVVMHDFVVGIQAKPGGEIPFWKIQEFIVWLREQGFNLGSIIHENMTRTGSSTYDKRKGGGIISTDGFQSRETQQRLRKQGFEVCEISADKTPEPYHAYKRAVVEERVYSPRNQLLTDELLDVEQTSRGKVDHSIRGSKDLADAIVCSFWSCMTNAHSSYLYADSFMDTIKSLSPDYGTMWNKEYGSFIQ